MSSTESSNSSLRTPSELQKVPFHHISAGPLSQDETLEAVKQNYVHTHKDFPRIERQYCDPPLVNQTYALVSFVPSPDAKPDNDGVFGCMKIRGVYGTIQEADERAEYLIQNVDSMQIILTTFVGRPFPILGENAQKYGAELRKIDVQQKTDEINKADLEKKRAKEQQEIAEIKKREQLLKADVATEAKDKPPEEQYTTARVKLSQLVYTAYEHRKRLDEVKTLIVKAWDEVKALETQELLEDYMSRYLSAREEAGLRTSDVEKQESFIKYMEDSSIDLDEISKM